MSDRLHRVRLTRSYFMPVQMEAVCIVAAMRERAGSPCPRLHTLEESEDYRFCNVEPTDEPPKDDPTELSCMLEPTLEGLMLEPTVESEMLESIVDR